MVVAHITPAKIKEYKCKQSKYEHAPELPMRSIAYGPSGTGKSVLLQQLILDVFRGCFERIYIWSPSIDIDHVWDPVKRYVRKELGVDTKEEKCFYSEAQASLQGVRKLLTTYSLRILISKAPI